MISWLCSRMSCCVISEVQHPAFSVSSARSKCCRSCVGQAGVRMGPCCLEAGLLFAHVHVSTETWGWGQRMLLFSKQPHTSFSRVFVSCPAAPRGCGRQCWWQPPKQTFRASSRRPLFTFRAGLPRGAALFSRPPAAGWGAWLGHWGVSYAGQRCPASPVHRGEGSAPVRLSGAGAGGEEAVGWGE